MSVIPLFKAIQAQIIANIGNTYPFDKPIDDTQKLTYVRMWNHQLEKWASPKEEGNDLYAVQFPCILIEFKNLSFEWLGNGALLYNDLRFSVHMIHKQIDSPIEGDHEQNLDVYALNDAVYRALFYFKPAFAVNFWPISSTVDSNHGNLYHFITEWQTNYVDLQCVRPVGGITVAGGTITPEITIT